MRGIGQIISVGCLLLVAGCGPQLHLKGTWIGYRKLDSRPEADPLVVKTLERVELRIDGAGHFVLFEQGIPKTGNIAYEGSKGLLQVREVANQPAEKSDPVSTKEITVHGKDLVYVDPDIPEPPVTLKPRP